MLPIKRLLLAFFLTIFLFVITIIIDRLLYPPIQNTVFNTFSFIIVIGSVLISIFAGLPNVLLLALLYYTKIGKEFLINIKLLILEVCLLCVCYYLVGKVINKLVESLPVQEVFSKDGGRKFYFTEGTQLVYTFIILFLLLLGIKKIFISGKVNQVKD
jgi:hypothetical protein